jgi:hypothetical protein
LGFGQDGNTGRMQADSTTDTETTKQHVASTVQPQPTCESSRLLFRRSFSLSSTSSLLFALSSLTVAATRSWFSCSCTSLAVAAVAVLLSAVVRAWEPCAADAIWGRELGVLKAGFALRVRVLGNSSCRSFSLCWKQHCRYQDKQSVSASGGASNTNDACPTIHVAAGAAGETAEVAEAV